MSAEPIPAITTKSFTTWLLLGLPATVLWAIGGWGALSLLGGLSKGSVTPGVGSSAASLGIMWWFIVLCSGGGIFFASRSLFRPVSWRKLACCTVLGFLSLFGSVLT